MIIVKAIVNGIEITTFENARAYFINEKYDGAFHSFKTLKAAKAYAEFITREK